MNYISKEKKDELEVELHEAKTIKRNEIRESLESARALGDLSENAEYHQAREDQAKLEERIAKIEEILKEAVIARKHGTDNVDINSQVTVKKIGEKEEKVFTIVGQEESDMAQGKISNNSPLGLALMGHKEGETIKFKTAKGEIEYKILKVA